MAEEAGTDCVGELAEAWLAVDEGESVGLGEM